MLSALLVLAAHAPEQDAKPTLPTTREAAWAAVRATGYDVAPDKPDATTGKAVHDGLRAFLSLATTAGDRAKGEPDTYPYLGVFMEWSTPKEVDPDEAARWLAAARPHPAAAFTPHLGRTASVWGYVPLTNATDPQALKAALDAFWADAAAISARYAPNPAPAPASTPRDLRFEPSLRLKRADQESLQRVFDSWGWHSDEAANAAIGGWCFSIRVGGRLLWVHGAMDGTKFSPRRFTVERLAAKGTTPEGAPLDIPNLYKMGFGTYYGGVFHPREAFVPFDLAKPLTLADLRRRVVAFARQG